MTYNFNDFIGVLVISWLFITLFNFTLVNIMRIPTRKENMLKIFNTWFQVVPYDFIIGIQGFIFIIEFILTLTSNWSIVS